MPSCQVAKDVGRSEDTLIDRLWAHRELIHLVRYQEHPAEIVRTFSSRNTGNEKDASD